MPNDDGAGLEPERNQTRCEVLERRPGRGAKIGLDRSKDSSGPGAVAAASMLSNGRPRTSREGRQEQVSHDERGLGAEPVHEGNRDQGSVSDSQDPEHPDHAKDRVQEPARYGALDEGGTGGDVNEGVPGTDDGEAAQVQARPEARRRSVSAVAPTAGRRRRREDSAFAIRREQQRDELPDEGTHAKCGIQIADPRVAHLEQVDRHDDDENDECPRRRVSGAEKRPMTIASRVSRATGPVPHQRLGRRCWTVRRRAHAPSTWAGRVG